VQDEKRFRPWECRLSLVDWMDERKGSMDRVGWMSTDPKHYGEFKVIGDVACAPVENGQGVSGERT